MAFEETRSDLRAAWQVLRDGLRLQAMRAPAMRARATCLVRVDGIGDFILWISACRALAAHERAAGARVVLVANALWADWARSLGVVDEVWTLERTRFARDLDYRRGWLRRMREAGFAKVVQAAQSRRPDECDALVRASAAAERMGPAGDAVNAPSWLLRLADRWYTRLVDCGGTDRHELERNAALVRALGIPEFRAAAPSLGAPLPPNPLAGRSGAYAVLVPGAGHALRAWPAASFAEIGRRLAGLGLDVVLAGGDGDRKANAALVQAVGERTIDFTGSTGLAELSAILAGARVAVSNETGAVHLAAAVGTPVVAITGGGHFGRFVPYPGTVTGAAAPAIVAHRMDCYGCTWRCIHPRLPGAPVKCIASIEVEDVWDAVSGCLPDEPAVPFMRGMAEQAAGKFDAAHASFREALRRRFRHEAAPDAPPPPGPRLPVPGVTLACVDCRNHELAVFALRRSMALCRFDRAVLFADRPLALPDIEVRVIPDIGSIADYSRFMVKELGTYIDTPHVLVVQYDGYVVNGGAWDPAFAQFDYVGAPWAEAGGARSVGNGGFSLRSRKLLEALRDPRISELVPEDVAICRTYRRLLEDEHGIRFAPPEVAARFSFETLPPSGPTLGFHGITHMARIVDMTPEQVAAYRPEPMRVYRKT